MTQPLHFIHISDTHIGPTRDFELRGVNPAKSAEQVVDAICALPFKPAFVIHTGDVAADPDEESYRLISEIFARINLPIRYVTGNHDSSMMLRKFVPSLEIDSVSQNSSVLSYGFSHGEHRFITLDAPTLQPFWQGELTDEQFAFLDRELEAKPHSLTIFLHYPAIPLSVPWMDEKMMLANGDKLHRRLLSLSPGCIRGVFSGHVHRGFSLVKDGILYQSGPSTTHQFETWPSTKEIVFVKTPPPAFNLVTYTGDSTIVQTHQVLD